MSKIQKSSGLLAIFTCLVLCSSWASAQNLRTNHPDEYVVKEGDTLWDIAGVFLDDPWKWPDIWQINQQVSNPHLIYPGDILRLIYVDGQPRLVMDRGVVKLSPEIRESTFAEAITAVPLDTVRDFFSKNLVISQEEIESAPYMVAGPEGRILVGQGDLLYARGQSTEGISVYGIYRQSDEYRDPETGDVLGVRAESKGTARYQNTAGDVMRMGVMESYAEIATGDRFLPLQQDQFDPQIFPVIPEETFSGQIISVEGGVSQIGLMDVVGINLGADKNLEVGHMLAIMEAGEEVRDRVAGETIILPDEQAGSLMIFKVYERMSFGLVLSSEKTLSVGHNVSSLFSQEAYDAVRQREVEEEEARKHIIFKDFDGFEIFKDNELLENIKGMFEPGSRPADSD